MDKLNPNIKPIKSKTCRYCKEECDYTICIYCDGKHIARRVHHQVGVERTIYATYGKLHFFNEDAVKESLMVRDIMGLDGFPEEEKTKFWSSFSTEYMRLKVSNENISQKIRQ